MDGRIDNPEESQVANVYGSIFGIITQKLKDLPSINCHYFSIRNWNSTSHDCINAIYDSIQKILSYKALI
jgi:hypothetical protein